MKRWIFALLCIASLQSCAVLNDAASRYSYHSRIKTSCTRHLPQKNTRLIMPSNASMPGGGPPLSPSAGSDYYDQFAASAESIWFRR